MPKSPSEQKKPANARNRSMSAGKKSTQEITLQHLHEFVVLWKYIKINPGISASDAWTACGIMRRRARDASAFIKEKELYFHRGQFFRGTKKLTVDEKQTGFIEELDNLLSLIDRGDHRRGKRQIIRFGVGHSVAMSLAPPILDRVRKDNMDLEVPLIIEDTDLLVEKLRIGRVDCVLGVLHPRTKNDSCLDLPIRPALISHISHPIARQFRSKKMQFVSKGLLTDFKSEIGVHFFDGVALKRPQLLLDGVNNVRFLSQPNYAAINEIVPNSNDLGITLPQFLTRAQALNLQVMPFDLPEDEQPRLQLLSCKELSKNYHNSLSSLTNGEFERVLGKFVEISKEVVIEKFSTRTMPLENSKFEIAIKLPNQDLEWWWVRGEFSIFVERDRSFTGELVLLETIPLRGKRATSYQRAFSVKGSIQANESDKELVVFRGRDDGRVPFKIGRDFQLSSVGEMFTGAFVRTASTLPAALGSWLGWEPGSATATQGPIVVLGSDTDVRCEEQLEAIVATERSTQLCGYQSV